jgi:hypothetical protein
MPKLEETGFGWIVIDGRRYDEDVLITVDGEVQQRPPLSKKYKVGHTPLGPEEVEVALHGGPEVLVIGTGQFGSLPVMPEAEAVAARHSVRIEKAITPEAMFVYEEQVHAGKRVAAILHLTC